MKVRIYSDEEGASFTEADEADVEAKLIAAVKDAIHRHGADGKNREVSVLIGPWGEEEWGDPIACPKCAGSGAYLFFDYESGTVTCRDCGIDFPIPAGHQGYQGPQGHASQEGEHHHDHGHEHDHEHHHHDHQPPSSARGPSPRATFAVPCDHSFMVPNDDPHHTWKCAKCGYVYGNEGWLTRLVRKVVGR